MKCSIAVTLCVALSCFIGQAAEPIDTKLDRATLDRATLNDATLDYTAAWGREFALLQEQIAQRPNWNNELLTAQTFHRESLILETDETPLDVVLRRTAALLKDLQSMSGNLELAPKAAELDRLRKLHKPHMPLEEQRALFDKVTALRRKIALANPLLDFSEILFVMRNKGGGHMCDQYFGHKARGGGGVYLLKNALSDSPRAEDLLADSPIQNGRLEGTLADTGNFVSLELSYDAKTIWFARSEVAGQGWTPEATYHIYTANVDGSNLTMLTDGSTNDFDPCQLPNGRIAFISERIGGFGRCHPRTVPTYTLHAMMADGSDIIPLSYHETNEWNPSIDNNGMIVYSRWDYVDRDSDIAHHIWHTYPDGRDPRSYHGNYPDDRSSRPWMELSVRAIPGSHRYIATAAPHHGHNYGSLVMIDLRINDDRSMSQLKRITPEARLPESERSSAWPGRGNAEAFATAWPLSENYYLCVYDPDGKKYGLFLLDCFGNKVLLYEDAKLPCYDPIPLKPRVKPPIIPNKTTHALADQSDANADPSTGIVTVMNVYESEFPFPEGTTIKELRIVNIFPKSTPLTNRPNVGLANQSLARGVLGTVPVEADGSIHFEVPTGISVYFQALDENGMVVQTMRSSTYLHPGETLGCIGCHESKNTIQGAARRPTVPLAMKRGPSKITPEVPGSYPLSFPRLVQPVLDAKCVACHDKEPKARSLRGDRFAANGWSEAFVTLHPMGWGKHGGNGSIRRNGGSYSIPGQVCAKVSKLYEVLSKEHYEVELTREELRRITLWIDCNTNFYGAYKQTEEQARGELIKPEFGLPPWIPFEKLVR